MATKAAVISQIGKVCDEIGANAPLMLAFAYVESSFNPNAGNGGKYVGLYQLSDGYGGCKGVQRNDIRQSTICCWKQIQSNKATFMNEYSSWQDWYAYGMHQQGVAGFKYLIRNKDKRISDIDAPRRTAVINNTPSIHKGKFVYVRDFLNHWQNKIDSLMQEYGHTPRTYTLPQVVVTEFKEAAKATPIALGLSLALLAGVIGYYWTAVR